MSRTNFSSWWGRHTIEPNSSDLWQVGPLKLWIKNQPKQWTLNWIHSGNWLDSEVRVARGAQVDLPPAEAFSAHCAMGGPSREEIVFAPSLPDRPLISRLNQPLDILPGESVQLFVVFPLWLRIELANPSKLLQEIPTFRLSDTWFGPMSINGEVSYSSTIPAFLDLSEVPLRLHCAVSSVHVHNLAEDSLRIERLQVPLPRLSLFFSARTGFWTNAISLERKSGDDEMARIRIEKLPPPEVAPSQFVVGPRLDQSDGLSMVRAFSALFRDRNQG